MSLTGTRAAVAPRHMGRLGTSAQLAATGRRLRLASHGGRAAENTPSEVPSRLGLGLGLIGRKRKRAAQQNWKRRAGPRRRSRTDCPKGCCGRSALACRRLRDLCDCASKALLLAPLSRPRTDKAEQTACAMVTQRRSASGPVPAAHMPAVRTTAARARQRRPRVSARSCTRAVSHDKARWRNLSHCSCGGDRGGSLGDTRGGRSMYAEHGAQGRGRACCNMLLRCNMRAHGEACGKSDA